MDSWFFRECTSDEQNIGPSQKRFLQGLCDFGLIFNERPSGVKHPARFSSQAARDTYGAGRGVSKPFDCRPPTKTPTARTDAYHFDEFSVSWGPPQRGRPDGNYLPGGISLIGVFLVDFKNLAPTHGFSVRRRP
jgi:hypothetical protein